MKGRFCEACGEKLARDSRFCTACGEPCGPGESAARCSCGAAVEPDARFCTSCGRPAPRPGLTPPPAPPVREEARPDPLRHAPLQHPRSDSSLGDYEIGGAPVPAAPSRFPPPARPASSDNGPTRPTIPPLPSPRGARAVTPEPSWVPAASSECPTPSAPPHPERAAEPRTEVSPVDVVRSWQTPHPRRAPEPMDRYPAPGAEAPIAAEGVEGAATGPLDSPVAHRPVSSDAPTPRILQRPESPRAPAPAVPVMGASSLGDRDPVPAGRPTPSTSPMPPEELAALRRGDSLAPNFFAPSAPAADRQPQAPPRPSGPRVPRVVVAAGDASGSRRRQAPAAEPAPPAIVAPEVRARPRAGEPSPERRWLIGGGIALGIVALMGAGFSLVWRLGFREAVGPAPVSPPAPSAPAPDAGVPATVPAADAGPRFGDSLFIAGVQPTTASVRRLVAIDPAGETLAALHPTGGQMALWRTSGLGDEVRLGSLASSPVGLAFSPDGRLLAASTVGVRPSVSVWDVRYGQELFAASLPDDGHGLSVTAQGRVLVVSGLSVMGLEPAAGRVFELCRPHGFLPVRAADETAAIDPAGTNLARVGGGSVAVWALPTGELRARSATLAAGSVPPGMAFRRDGRYLAVGEGSTVVVRDSGSLRPERVFKGHGGDVTSVAWSDDGRLLVSAGGGDVRLWDVPSGRLLDRVSVQGEAAVAVGPGGRRVAVADASAVRVVPVR